MTHLCYTVMDLEKGGPERSFEAGLREANKTKVFYKKMVHTALQALIFLV